MTQAYIYIRFSSAKQERGDSKERQLLACQGHCERNGWELAEPPFGDLGVSAWKGANLLATGELGKFTARVKSGEIPVGSILCVEDLDRLSRQEPRVTLRWMEDLIDLGVRIATVNGDDIYDKKSLAENILKILQILIKSQLANEMPEKLSARVKAAWVRRREKAATGKIISAKVPFWLSVTIEDGERVLSPIPKRVEVVQQIYQMAADGMGSRSIATTLNRNGVKPFGAAHHHKNASNVGWEHTYIGDILASPAVEGDYEPGFGRKRVREKTGERYVGYFGEPIVDADLVARARAAVISRKGTGGAKRTQCTNLFSGLAVCAGCSSTMNLVGNSKNPGAFLICSNASRGRGCDHKSYFSYKSFEPSALDAILHYALDDKFFRRPDNSRQLAIEVAETEKLVANKADEIARLISLLARVEDPSVEAALRDLITDRDKLTADLKNLRTALAAARGGVDPAEHMRRVLEVRSALNDSDYDTRVAARLKVSEALRSVVDKIICDERDTFSGQPERAIILIFNTGRLAVKFDNKGNTLATVEGQDATAVAEGGALVADMIRRLKANPITSTPAADPLLNASGLHSDKDKAVRTPAMLSP